MCHAALDEMGAAFQKREDFTQGEICGIPQRLLMQSFATATIGPLESQCHIMLRLALWERDVVQPAATALYAAQVEEIFTQGSYNCRTIRGAEDTPEALSEHATANAVDITGVRLSTGQEISLEVDWGSGGREDAFLKVLRDGGCNIFRATLGPDFNEAHKDHFHFDVGRYRVCR